MDHFIEGDDHNLFSEREAESILYSLVHHDHNRPENTTKLNTQNEYSISRKSKALRWNSVRTFSDSSDAVRGFSHPVESNEILDYVPLDSSVKTSCTVSNNNIAFVERNSRKNRRNKRNRNGPRVPYIRSLVCVNLVDKDVKRKSFESSQNHSSLSTKSISPRVNKNLKSCSQNFAAIDNGVSKSDKEVDCRRKESDTISMNHDFIDSKINETTQKFQDNVIQVENVKSVQQSSDEDVLIVNVSDEINQSTASVGFIGQHKVDPEILTLSDSESGNDSIIEVTVTPKPSPILIALDSSDETEKGTATVPISISNVNNNCLNRDKKVKIKTELHLANLVTISQNEGNLVQRTNKRSDNISHSSSSNIPEAVKKKKKPKKTKKWLCLENSIPCAVSMHKFYNQSWGGETFDHVKMQRAMTDNPSKWQILEVDKYGPLKIRDPLARVRCANCHQFGHLARMCPDPHKIKSCFMCGMPGHNEFKCPSKICLKCGRPATLYNSGCPLCWSKDHPPNCSTCGDEEHYSWMCPSVWRNLHSVTTADEMNTINSQVTVYKPNENQSCCYCAKQGHNATCCPYLSRPCKSSIIIDPLYSRSPRGKKRKKTRNSAHSWRWGDDLHRKRRKTN